MPETPTNRIAVSRRRSPRMSRPGKGEKDVTPVDTETVRIDFKRIAISERTHRAIRSYAAYNGISIPAAYGNILLKGLERTPKEQTE